MKISGRRAARVLSACAASMMLLGMLAAPAPLPTAKPALPAAGESATARQQETRLRKLHLVRPDLIPYPIAFEVYC